MKFKKGDKVVKIQAHANDEIKFGQFCIVTEIGHFAGLMRVRTKRGEEWQTDIDKYILESVYTSPLYEALK